MKKLSDKELIENYNVIKQYHKQYLESKGVKMPKLKINNHYTKDALILIYLTQGYPNTSAVSKSELTEFIKLYFPDTNDVQQARHLGAQNGWFILSGTRNDNPSMAIPKGYYKLVSLEKPYEGFTANRRELLITNDSWTNLKKSYDNKCACCGSEEGKPHRYWKNTIVKLQKGHKDPSKPLELSNIIPQCTSCNQADLNNWIYDDKGRVIAVANERVIDHCDLTLQKKIYSRLYKKFNGKKPE